MRAQLHDNVVYVGFQGDGHLLGAELPGYGVDVLSDQARQPLEERAWLRLCSLQTPVQILNVTKHGRQSAILRHKNALLSKLAHHEALKLVERLAKVVEKLN